MGTQRKRARAALPGWGAPTGNPREGDSPQKYSGERTPRMGERRIVGGEEGGTTRAPGGGDGLGGGSWGRGIGGRSGVARAPIAIGLGVRRLPSVTCPGLEGTGSPAYGLQRGAGPGATRVGSSAGGEHGVSASALDVASTERVRTRGLIEMPWK